MDSNIEVQITDWKEFHCFRLLLTPRNAEGQQIEVMLHATALVDLIEKCSTALCKWQYETTGYLIQQKTGLSEEEARRRGFIA
jgi:hypothetical protein